MSIVGQNTLLNQYVPTFFVKNLVSGQTLIYDSVRKAFVNSSVGGGLPGATKLGQLTDVNPSVDNPTLVQNGQALVYNTTANLWQNQFIDYNTLINKPSNATYSFLGLSDVNPTPVPNGFVQWNSLGTELIYSTSIPSTSVTGLATVAYTGSYTDLINIPAGGGGTVTDVSIVTSSGINGTVATPTVTPTIILSLGDITPTSVAAIGTLSGSNFSGLSSGTNTGDQTITISGDATGISSNTAGSTSLPLTLSNSGVTAGTYGSSIDIPILHIDAKGRVTSASSIAASFGTVSNVSVVTANGISGTVATSTTTPALTLTLGDITPTSVISSGFSFDASLLPKAKGLNVDTPSHVTDPVIVPPFVIAGIGVLLSQFVPLKCASAILDKSVT